MPRNTRASRRGESSQTTWEQPEVLSGEEDGVAPPGRITREAKEHLRGMQMSFTKRMYEYAKAFQKISSPAAAERNQPTRDGCMDPWIHGSPWITFSFFLGR